MNLRWLLLIFCLVVTGRCQLNAQMATPLPPSALEGGTGWINTRSPIHFQDLRGKIVLLDFWTYCCINCHHILPDLERLEQKYANQLVVIGVHSGKFDAEKSTFNIRQKVAEYRIKHPVVNDAGMVLWKRFQVDTWPTLVLIDPLGRVRTAVKGEGHGEALDRAIGQLVVLHRSRGELNETPLRFEPEVEKAHEAPLLYPGKVTIDPATDRLFITDTGHNRIVVTTLEGRLVHTIGNGAAGLVDGSFDKAQFNRPQGTRLADDGRLYVADTENHAIRAIDFDSRTVTTVAGTGVQSQARSGSGPARSSALNSPWDILQDPSKPELFYIAMAGPHQIWTYNRESDRVAVWAGSGLENIADGTRASAAFAQPSGLATDGKRLFVADSETSGIRAISLTGNRVETIVGVGLFGFGDRDGHGREVRLQHCLGVAYHEDEGKLYIADSYNNKIKVCQPGIRAVKTLMGRRAGGFDDAQTLFDEPGGLAIGDDGQLYVADTNNHAIRVVDPAALTVRTLTLSGVTRPETPETAPIFPNAVPIAVAPLTRAPTDRLSLAVAIDMPPGYQINPVAPIPYLLSASEGTGGLKLAPSVSATGGQVEPPAAVFVVDAPLDRTAVAGDTISLTLSASVFLCRDSLCEVHSYVWTIPIQFEAGAGKEPIPLTPSSP